MHSAGRWAGAGGTIKSVPRYTIGLLAAAVLWAAPHSAMLARAQTLAGQAASTTTPPSTEQQSAQASTTQSAFDPYNPDDVGAKVRAYFADTPIMVAVAKCESGFRQYDDVGNPLYGGTGGMVGVFQEAAAIHGDAAKAMGLDINTLDGNLAYARYLYETSGLTPWLASASCWSPIKSTLRLGSTGQEVALVQKMLNESGFTVAEDGPGSPGQESTTFGPMTRAALRRFQCKAGIVCSGTEQSTGYGLVGAKTRLALLQSDAHSANLSVR